MVIYEGSPGDAHSSSWSVAVCVVCNHSTSQPGAGIQQLHTIHTGSCCRHYQAGPSQKPYIQVTSDCVNAKYIMHAKSHGPSP